MTFRKEWPAERNGLPKGMACRKEWPAERNGLPKGMACRKEWPVAETAIGPRADPLASRNDSSTIVPRASGDPQDRCGLRFAQPTQRRHHVRRHHRAIAVRRTASLRSPMTRWSMLSLSALRDRMDCRVEPGNDAPPVCGRRVGLRRGTRRAHNLSRTEKLAEGWSRDPTFSTSMR